MGKEAFESIKLVSDQYLKEASFSPEDDGCAVLSEVFNVIYKMPMTRKNDMGDAVNQRFVKLPNGDKAWRYTRRAIKTKGKNDDEYRWPRAEENERVSFFLASKT